MHYVLLVQTGSYENPQSFFSAVGQSALDSHELLNKPCPKDWLDEDSFVEMHSDYPD